MTRRKRADPATDGRDEPGPSEWASQWRPDLEDVARFIENVEANRAPPRLVMERLALALRQLFCHRDADESLRAFAKKLGLRVKQGKREATAKETEHRFAAVWEMLELEAAQIADGVSVPTARARAIREVATRLGVARRTASEWRSSGTDVEQASVAMMGARNVRLIREAIQDGRIDAAVSYRKAIAWLSNDKSQAMPRRKAQPKAGSAKSDIRSRTKKTRAS